MRFEARLFFGVGAFLYVVAIVYGVWSHEAVGATALVLSGTFCAMIGGYFQFIARRIEPRPEDRNDAEVADGAGELGFFSPYSYWPFGIGLAAFGFAVSTAFWQAWAMMITGAFLLAAVCGLVFEYYIGQNRA